MASVCFGGVKRNLRFGAVLETFCGAVFGSAFGGIFDDVGLPTSVSANWSTAFSLGVGPFLGMMTTWFADVFFSQ